VRRAAELRSDVVLMDVHLPDIDGVHATWLIASRTLDSSVIMVTSEERTELMQRAGSNSQGMPLWSTNRRPASAARAGTRGRPPLGLGGAGEGNGSIDGGSVGLEGETVARGPSAVG
jgi:CheY-like chemotaxis protein